MEEGKYNDFRDLEVWKQCKGVRNKIWRLCKDFPREEKYRLSDQMIRASRSSTACIAEGYGRFHYQENIQFCRQSRGSLYELIDHLTICLDEEYINNDEFTKYRDDCTRGIQLVNGYIRYLSKQKKESQ